MLTAVLVELDGVLVDTRTARADAVTAAFAAIDVDRSLPRPASSIDRPDAQPVVDDVSSGIEELVHAVARTGATAGDPMAALDDTALALIVLRAEREYRDRVAAGVTLVDGARDAVGALAAEWRLAIVTAWRRADAERVLAFAGLAPAVRFIAAADDGPGFASVAGRYGRAVARARRGATLDPHTGTAPDVRPGTIAALVAGPVGSEAARNAGALAVVAGRDVSVPTLTASRFTAALDAAPRPLVAPVPSRSALRR
ncbi:MAG TPA: hypothetical protein VGD56_05685 [Gemmatirosa sp.]